MSDPSANERLLEAAGLGDIGAIRAALADGAGNLDEALFAAVEAGHVAAAGYLIDRGANPRATRPEEDDWVGDENCSVFDVAARESSLEMIQFILGRIAFSSREIYSALWQAWRGSLPYKNGAKQYSSLFFLFELYGLDSVSEHWSYSAHFLASAANREEETLVRGLLERGARLGLPSSLTNNHPPVSWRIARLHGRQLIAQLLREISPEEADALEASPGFFGPDTEPDPFAISNQVVPAEDSAPRRSWWARLLGRARRRR